MTRQAAAFTKDIAPALARSGRRVRRLARPRRRRARPAHPCLRRSHLPGAHAARGRPRPPVPVHLQPVVESRRGRARQHDRRRALRARQGAAAAAPVRAGSRHVTVRARSNRSSPRTSTRCSRAWRCSEHHPFRVTRDADIELDRRIRRLARGDGDRAPPAHEVRARGAPRSRHRRVARRCSSCCAASSSSTRTTCTKSTRRSTSPACGTSTRSAGPT